jgi:hypothetical protein
MHSMTCGPYFICHTNFLGPEEVPHPIAKNLPLTDWRHKVPEWDRRTVLTRSQGPWCTIYRAPALLSLCNRIFLPEAPAHRKGLLMLCDRLPPSRLGRYDKREVGSAYKQERNGVKCVNPTTLLNVWMWQCSKYLLASGLVRETKRCITSQKFLSLGKMGF